MTDERTPEKCQSEHDMTNDQLVDFIMQARPLMAELRVEGSYVNVRALNLLSGTVQHYAGLLVTRGAEDMLPEPEQRPAGGRAIYGQPAAIPIYHG